jgi:hypothetical protein
MTGDSALTSCETRLSTLPPTLIGRRRSGSIKTMSQTDNHDKYSGSVPVQFLCAPSLFEKRKLATVIRCCGQRGDGLEILAYQVVRPEQDGVGGVVGHVVA